jgi:aminopeptidase N
MGSAFASRNGSLKKSLFIFALILVLATGGCRQIPALSVAGTSTSAPTLPASPSDYAWDDRKPFESGLVASARPILGQLPEATVYHLDIKIEEDLAHLTGHEQVRYTNHSDSDLDKLAMRLYPNIMDGRCQVSNLSLNGDPIQATYGLKDSVMWLPLKPALLPGESVTLSLDFSVSVPGEGGGNYGIFAFRQGILALAHFYPVIPVYNDEGWNVELPPSYGDPTFLESSFYLARFEAPSDVMLVASGNAIASSRQDGELLTTFAAGPARDFYLVAGRDLQATQAEVGQTQVTSYAAADYASVSRRVLNYAIGALKDYNRRFGEYPYTEFDIVGTSNDALGIEYPGVVALTLRFYDPAGNLPQGYLEATVAHEVSHQWFFNLVGDDQLDQPWLDEAVAQYATLLYFGDTYGPGGADGFRQSLVERWNRVGQQAIPIGRPVRYYTPEEYGAIVYGRGPLFLQALAERMGQDQMDRFLKIYVADYSWGVATTAGFESLAEKTCACDLQDLFRAWVLPTSTP